LVEERWRVAGEDVEVVHPRCGGGLEDAAPDEAVGRPADEVLPGVGGLRVQAALGALGLEVRPPRRHPLPHALHPVGVAERRLWLPLEKPTTQICWN